MPRHIPKNGLSRLIYSFRGSVKPLELSVSIALPKDPTPGNTITLFFTETKRSGEWGKNAHEGNTNDMGTVVPPTT